MSDFETELARVVQDFVTQVAELARRAAIQTLEGALGKSTGTSRGTSMSMSMSSGSSRAASSGGRRGRRSPEEMDDMRASILKYVKTNPGSRTEQIKKHFGTTSNELALPIRQLVEEGALKTKGERRGMQYFVK